LVAVKWSAELALPAGMDLCFYVDSNQVFVIELKFLEIAGFVFPKPFEENNAEGFFEHGVEQILNFLDTTLNFD
jgi:hypothetical protein